MEIPFAVMALITMAWVLIGAVFIMPHFAEKKMTKEGGRIDTLEGGFHRRLDGMEWDIASKVRMLESTVNERVNDVNVHVADIKSKIDEMDLKAIDSQLAFIKEKVGGIDIPGNIPDMDQITKLIEDGRANTIAVLEDVQLRLSKNMQAVNDNIPIHIASGIKSMEGRLYRAKGIVQADHEKGMDVAKEVIMKGIEDEGDNAPVMQIVRHFVKVAADAELIDPENADQKIGLVQGILEGVKMFQNRGNSPMGGNALMGSSPPGHSSLPSQGDGMEGYYR